MKAFSKAIKRNMACVAVIAVVLIAGSTSAFAIPATQLARVLKNQTITGKCCVLFGASVRVTEPSMVVPVVVTWSTDYQNSNEWILSGLSLNGGPCSFYGSGSFPVFKVTNQWAGTSHEWIVFPADGLVQGVNTFQVCAGGAYTTGAHITFGFNTLAVRISK